MARSLNDDNVVTYFYRDLRGSLERTQRDTIDQGCRVSGKFVKVENADPRSRLHHGRKGIGGYSDAFVADFDVAKEFAKVEIRCGRLSKLTLTKSDVVQGAEGLRAVCGKRFLKQGERGDAIAIIACLEARFEKDFGFFFLFVDGGFVSRVRHAWTREGGQDEQEGTQQRGWGGHEASLHEVWRGGKSVDPA